MNSSCGFLDLLLPEWYKRASKECPYPYQKPKIGRPSNKVKELKKLRDDFIESKRPIVNNPNILGVNSNIRNVRITYIQRNTGNE